MPADKYPQKDVGLPFRPFLYTLDQIAGLLSMTDREIKRYVFFEGKSVGAHTPDKIYARSIAPIAERPDWRVTEVELLRWMRRLRFRVYYRGWPSQ